MCNLIETFCILFTLASFVTAIIEWAKGNERINLSEFIKVSSLWSVAGSGIVVIFKLIVGA